MKGSGTLVLVAGALALGGCGVASLDTYDMPVAQAYAKLAAIDLEDVEGPFQEGRDIRVEKKENESLRWTSGKGGRFDCVATLSALEATRTRVAVSCAERREMFGGMLARMSRSNVIEKVDSTLRDRPFDAEQAKATAARYPADTVRHKDFAQDYSEGVGQAFRTQREVMEMQRDWEADVAAARTAGPSSASGYTPHRPGEPTLRLD